VSTPLSANGTLPSAVAEAARYYLDRGFLPIPVIPRGKKPIGDGWEQQRPTAETIADLFPADGHRNVGLLLGKPSGGLVDVDLDSPEAIAAAPVLLPPTGWVSGRASCPRSHWWYRVEQPPDKASTKYKDLGGQAGESVDEDEDQEDENRDTGGKRVVLVELRSTKGQTVVCPSVHPSGEPVVWHEFGQPANVPLPELLTAVGRVAAAALLARQRSSARAGHRHPRRPVAGRLDGGTGPKVPAGRVRGSPDGRRRNQGRQR
jgi:hypothetical protein